MTIAEAHRPQTNNNPAEAKGLRYAECFFRFLNDLEAGRADNQTFSKTFYIPDDEISEEKFKSTLGLITVVNPELRLPSAGMYDNLELVTTPLADSERLEIVRQNLITDLGAMVTYFAHTSR